MNKYPLPADCPTIYNLIRRANSYTKERLAKELEISCETYAKIDNGLMLPDPVTQSKLFDLFHWNPADISRHIIQYLNAMKEKNDPDVPQPLGGARR